jgi:hypothetical protein
MGFEEVFLQRNQILSEKIIKELRSRQFEAYFCANKNEALSKALSLIPKKSSVSWGGSETIVQIGLLDELKKSKDYTVIDRDSAPDKEKRFELMRSALLCDTFLMSANAITQDGQLINIDGMGNRLSALLFGPKSIIVIVGMNKVSPTVKDAIKRVRNYAAPLNAARLNIKDTPCGLTGQCGDCKSPATVCSYIVTTRFCKIPNRIKVILVGESLGY